MLRKIKRLLNTTAILESTSARRHDELTYRIGLFAVTVARASYEKVRRIEQADLQVFSQNGEDGIIDFLVTKLGTAKPTFVEIGTQDYSESNTRFLFQRTSSKGLIIDCDPQLTEKVKAVLGSHYVKGDLTAASSFVTRGNIDSLLLQGSSNWLDCDIFSLDIDGNDYWIMKDIIAKCKHKIIILEYNAYFGSKASVTIPYQESFNRTDYHYSNLCWGASLKAFTTLLANNGYIFAGTNLSNINGFWVREDQFPALGIESPSIHDLSPYTQNNCRESRDINGNLSFLSGDSRLTAIRDCHLVNLEKQEALQTVAEIFSI